MYRIIQWLACLGIGCGWPSLQLGLLQFIYMGQKMKKTLLASALVLASASSFAAWEDYDVEKTYLQFNVTQSTYDIGSDVSATGYNLTVGVPYVYEWTKDSPWHTAVELSLYNLGEGEVDITAQGVGTLNTKAEASGWMINSLFGYDVNAKTSVFGRVGFNNITYSVNVEGFTAEEKSGKLTWAVGGAYKLTKQLSATADYTSFASDTTGFTAGVSYDF